MLQSEPLKTNYLLQTIFLPSFTFLDLLIKFMKMRLLYIYCSTAPALLQHDGKDTFIPSPFYICQFSAPPPPPSCLPIGWRTGPSHSHVFCRRRERGETGITSLHVRWQRAQRILVLVMLMPHMENSQG